MYNDTLCIDKVQKKQKTYVCKTTQTHAVIGWQSEDLYNSYIVLRIQMIWPWLVYFLFGNDFVLKSFTYQAL